MLYEIVLHKLVPIENMPAIEFNAFFEKMSELGAGFLGRDYIVLSFCFLFLPLSFRLSFFIA